MVDSKAKGSRAEEKARDILRQHTGLRWERTPFSGALSATHKLKGDLYIPGENNSVFCVEIKHYAEDNFTSKIFTDKSPTLISWWEQTLRESEEIEKYPLLIYKFDRSKWFVATLFQPLKCPIYSLIKYNDHEFYTLKLEDWLEKEKPKFICH